MTRDAARLRAYLPYSGYLLSEKNVDKQASLLVMFQKRSTSSVLNGKHLVL